MMQDSVANEAMLKKTGKEIEKWYNELDNDNVRLTKNKNGCYNLYFQIRMAEQPDTTQSRKVKIVVPTSYNPKLGSPGIQFRELSSSDDEPLDFISRCNTVFKNRPLKLTKALALVVKKFNEFVDDQELTLALAENSESQIADVDCQERNGTDDNKAISDIPRIADALPRGSEMLNTEQIPDDRSASRKREKVSESLPGTDAPKHKASAFGLNRYQRIAALTTIKKQGEDTLCRSIPSDGRDSANPAQIVEIADEVVEDRSSRVTQLVVNGSDVVMRRLVRRVWIFRCLVGFMLVILAAVLLRG